VISRYRILYLFAAITAAVSFGCSQSPSVNPAPAMPADARVDFADPVLNSRQILLFGEIDQSAGERVIQKLLFLDGKSHEPIDLFLQTPGGDMKASLAIERIMRLIHSPVNTYALSECNSGGAYLLAAGTGKRRTFRGTLIVIHGLNIRDTPPPGAAEMLQDTYTRFWREKSRLPDTWLPIPFNSYRVMSAEEAL
jgi:ATP-dependent protease ClpP protease subunit